MANLSEDQWHRIQGEFSFRYIRSSGPGGQKVNKTASKAELHWDIRNTQALPAHMLARLLKKLEGQITAEGELLIQADSFRSRLQNKDDAKRRLREVIDNALFEPKKRRPTRPKKSAVQKRLKTKKEHGDKKRGRQKVDC